MKFLPFLKYLQKKRGIFLAGMASLILILSLIQTKKEICSIIRDRKIQSHVFLGDQFKNLKDILKNTPKIGYYSDKPMTVIANDALFRQAQYTLAPILLDMGSLDYPFIIFNYQNTESALKNIENLGMIPLRRSPSGIILAANPKYQKP